VHTISVLFAIPSQWGLQYFELAGAIQLQAALAHFLGLAIVLLWIEEPHTVGLPCGTFDAALGRKGSPASCQDVCRFTGRPAARFAVLFGGLTPVKSVRPDLRQNH